MSEDISEKLLGDIMDRMSKKYQTEYYRILEEILESMPERMLEDILRRMLKIYQKESPKKYQK